MKSGNNEGGVTPSKETGRLGPKFTKRQISGSCVKWRVSTSLMSILFLTYVTFNASNHGLATDLFIDGTDQRLREHEIKGNHA